MTYTQKPHLICLIGLIVFSACQRKLDTQSYVRWVKDYDNLLHVRQELGGVVYDVQFIPAEYKRLQASSELSGIMNSRSLQDDSVQFYQLTLCAKNPNVNVIHALSTNEVDLQRNQYYFNFLFQNDITLLQEGSEYPCTIYHYQPQTDNCGVFLLGFHAITAEDVIVQFKSELLSALPVKIKISMKNIPSLDV